MSVITCPMFSWVSCAGEGWLAMAAGGDVSYCIAAQINGINSIRAKIIMKPLVVRLYIYAYLSHVHCTLYSVQVQDTSRKTSYMFILLRGQDFRVRKIVRKCRKKKRKSTPIEKKKEKSKSSSA